MSKRTATPVAPLIAWLVVATAAGATFVGCDQPKPAATASAAPASNPAGPPAAVPAGFVLDKAPAEVKDLAAVRSAGVKDGDEVSVRAIVGGEAEPFKADQAVVRVMDASVMRCDQMGMDKDACPTPWDACCHQKDVRAKGAVVKVLSTDGAPLKGTLQGVGGLKPAAELVVQGKARNDPASGLVIEATHVYVKG